MLSAKLTKPNNKHVALHPRFSGQRDELDEQFDQSMGWMPRTVAHQANQGRLMQEQLPQTVAKSAPSTSSTNDQVQYLRAQLAYQDAQLEHVRSERDTCFVQEEDLLAHSALLSSEAKDWKSRVVSEAEQVVCKESAEADHRTTEVQETWTNSFKPDGESTARWRDVRRNFHLVPCLLTSSEA